MQPCQNIPSAVGESCNVMWDLYPNMNQQFVLKILQYTVWMFCMIWDWRFFIWTHIGVLICKINLWRRELCKTSWWSIWVVQHRTSCVIHVFPSPSADTTAELAHSHFSGCYIPGQITRTHSFRQTSQLRLCWLFLVDTLLMDVTSPSLVLWQFIWLVGNIWCNNVWIQSNPNNGINKIFFF